MTKIVMEMMKEPNGSYCYIAPTYKQAKNIAWRMFEEIIPRDAIKRKNDSELTIELKNNSYCQLKGAEDPDKLRGEKIKGSVFDEYAFMKPYAWEVVAPALLDLKGWAMFISTPDGYNHFYDLCNINDPDYSVFHFTSYDNPYLDKDEIDKEKNRISEEKFAQEYMAEFMKRSGAIWPMYTRDLHAVERREPDRNATIFGSLDFGFAIGHETAVLWHEVSSRGVYTFDGFQVAQKGIHDIHELMQAQTNGLIINGVFADPARPDLIDELSRRGWPMLPTNKDVEMGIAKVAEYLQYDPIAKKPKWTHSKHLLGLSEQMENYVWQEVRGDDGKFKQYPKKEFDHYPDCIRYFMNSYYNEQKKTIPLQPSNFNSTIDPYS